MMQVIIFVGLPGSGKTTYYKEHFLNTHLRISNDLLKTKNREKLLLEFCKNTEMSFVIDNTNVQKQNRKKYLDIIKSWQQEISIKCIYFVCDVSTCIERNAKRSGKDCIPDCAIYSKAKLFEEPNIDEGFDEIEIINTSEVLK